MIFRVGDYVELVRDSNSLRKGEVYRVTRVAGGGWIRISSTNSLYNPSLFKLYKDNDEMSKFNIGDKVRKISYGTPAYPVGYEGEVTKVSGNLLYLDNKMTNSSDEYWELVEDKDKYPNGKHPHHDVILEYAKGAEIEFQSSYSKVWYPATFPHFSPNLKYRVKPQQDPAVQAAKKKIEQASRCFVKLTMNWIG